VLPTCPGEHHLRSLSLGALFKRGSGAPVCGEGVVPPRIVGLARRGQALDVETPDLDGGNANDGGVDFRAVDGHWMFNLKTTGLPSGTYTFAVQMMDKSRWVGGCALQ